MSDTPEDPFAQQPPQPQGHPQQYAQPQYAQPGYPPQYYAQPGAPRNGTQKNWMGITSLVLSLVGLLTWFTAIAGIVFGHLGLAAARRGEADNRGVSLGGLITGYVIAVLGLLMGIAMIAFLAWAASECGGDNPADWCTGDDGSFTWEFDAG